MFNQLIKQIAALSPENRAHLLALYQQLFQQKEVEKANYSHLIAEFPYIVIEDQSIVAAFGLDRRPSPHKLIIHGVERFTWCVWDAFFLAEILADQADIYTHDPINKKPLTIQWRSGHWQLAKQLYASFPLANEKQPTRLRAAFCQFVHLFSSQQNAEQYSVNNNVEIVDIATLLQRSRKMAQALLIHLPTAESLK